MFTVLSNHLSSCYCILSNDCLQKYKIQNANSNKSGYKRLFKTFENNTSFINID